MLWFNVADCYQYGARTKYLSTMDETDFAAVTQLTSDAWTADTRNTTLPFRDHTAERISVKNREGGTCTPLPNFSKAIRKVIQELTAIIQPLMATLLASDQSSVVNSSVFAASGVSALVKYIEGSDDLFKVSIRTADCREPIHVSAGPLSVPIYGISDTFSLKKISAAIHSTANQCLSSNFKPTLKIMQNVMVYAGMLPTEPMFSLSWFPPQRTFSPAPPNVTCPERVNLIKGCGNITMEVFDRKYVTWESGPAYDSLRLGQEGNLHFSDFIYMSDPLNVSSIAVIGEGVKTVGQTFIFSADPHNNVVIFRVTNMLGLTGECKTKVTTFTAQAEWQPENMKVGGEIAVPDFANGSNGSTYNISNDGSDANAPRTDVDGAANLVNPRTIEEFQVVYYVGGTYSVRGPTSPPHNFTKARLFENYGGNNADDLTNAQGITFKTVITPQVSRLAYVDGETGDLILSPQEEHLKLSNGTQYTIVLKGRDLAGAEAVVKRWKFTIKRRPEFTVESYTWKTDSSAAVKERAKTPFALGASFKFGPVTIEVETNEICDTCTFTIKGNATAESIFINPKTGEVQGVVTKAAIYRLELIAQAENNGIISTAPVESIFLKFQPKDTDVARQSQILTSRPFFVKMAQNLDLRCVLVPAPWVLGPKHVSNPE